MIYVDTVLLTYTFNCSILNQVSSDVDVPPDDAPPENPQGTSSYNPSRARYLCARCRSFGTSVNSQTYLDLYYRARLHAYIQAYLGCSSQDYTRESFREFSDFNFPNYPNPFLQPHLARSFWANRHDLFDFSPESHHLADLFLPNPNPRPRCFRCVATEPPVPHDPIPFCTSNPSFVRQPDQPCQAAQPDQPSQAAQPDQPCQPTHPDGPSQAASPDQPCQSASTDQPCQRVQPPRSSHTSPHPNVQPQQLPQKSLILNSQPGDSSSDDDDSED